MTVEIARTDDDDGSGSVRCAKPPQKHAVNADVNEATARSEHSHASQRTAG
jgi:hypothetical protein